MSNKVNFTMKSVPAGLDSMYVRVEEDALTLGVRNVLYSGEQAVTGDTVEIDIGENGVVGNGAIISADNYTSGGAAFKSFSGYSLIEAGELPPTGLPTFDYDAVVVLGDSITVQSLAGAGKEETFNEFAVHNGIPITTTFYATGLSGHTMKTFTDKFVNNVGTQEPNRFLSDYETLLAGKKVLFLSMLGANDLRGFNDSLPENYEQDFQDKKVEVELWTKTLRDAIVNSLAFEATFGIIDFTYVDWRAGQNMEMDNLYEIIEGLHPQYDQRRFVDEVLKPLGATYCPEFMNNGDFVLDMYTETRNVFRYWLADVEAVHPSVETFAFLPKTLTEKFKEWLDTGSIAKVALYDYADEVMAVGTTSVVNFNYGLLDINNYLEPNGIAITNSLQNEGMLNPALLDNSTGLPIGKTYSRNGSTGVGVGQANVGDTTPTLDSEFVTGANMFSSTDKPIVNEGLPANATFDVEVCTASGASGLSLKVVDTVTGNTAVIEDTEVVGAGNHKKVSLVGQSDANGKMTITVGSNTGGSFRVAGYSLTRTA